MKTANQWIRQGAPIKGIQFIETECDDHDWPRGECRKYSAMLEAIMKIVKAALAKGRGEQ